VSARQIVSRNAYMLWFKAEGTNTVLDGRNFENVYCETESRALFLEPELQSFPETPDSGDEVAHEVLPLPPTNPPPVQILESENNPNIGADRPHLEVCFFSPLIFSFMYFPFKTGNYLINTRLPAF